MSTREQRRIALLQEYDLAYVNGKPLISDAKYNRLRPKWQKLYPNNPYFNKISAPLQAKGRKEVKLPLRMQSLNKKRPSEAIKWLAGLPKGTEFMVLPKLDGFALMLEYINGKFTRAFTRGEDGVTGFDVTKNARHMQGVIPKFIRFTDHSPAKGTTYVLCEAIIHTNIFNKHYKGKQIEEGGRAYKNARNFVIGMINRLNLKPVHIKALQHMTAVAFNFIREEKGKRQYFDKAEAIAKLSFHGFTTIVLPVRKGGKFRPLENFWYPDSKRITVAVLNSLLTNWRQRFSILQDGLVLEINQHRLRSQYGFNEPRPGYAYAIKAEVEDQVSHNGLVKEIDLQMSSRRLFIPVWVLDKKLDFDGVEVERISANNCFDLMERKAGPGSIIQVVRSGDVIPHYISTVKPAPVKLPKRCMHCETKLQWTTSEKTGKMVHLYCPNERCPGPHLRILRRFFTVLKIKGMAKGMIEAMVNAGLNTVPKILTATPKRLAKVEGFGERKIQIVIEGLRKLVKNVPLARLMKASNVFANETLGFGEERFEPIIQKLGRKAVLTGALDEAAKRSMRLKMMEIPGIGERVAQQFVDGLPAFREFYRELINIVTLAKEQRGGKLAGKVFAFTNFRNANMEQLIEKHGGKVAGVTNATTVLFAASLDSDKATKAAERGIKTVMQDKAEEYLNKLLKA